MAIDIAGRIEYALDGGGTRYTIILSAEEYGPGGNSALIDEANLKARARGYTLVEDEYGDLYLEFIPRKE